MDVTPPAMPKMKFTDECMPLDIRKLMRCSKACIEGVFIGTWTGATDESAPISTVFTFVSDTLIRVAHQGGHIPNESLAVTYTACPFGSRRAWFSCSTPGCGCRIAVLYATPNGFRCRRCARLRYRSQMEQAPDRTLRAARRVRHRLGGGNNLFDPFPQKPKGMHWQTYDRLLLAEYHFWSGFNAAAK